MFETHVQGFTPPTLPAHLDEEPTDILQWKREVLFTSDEIQAIPPLIRL
jgi:hypothetical protein